MEERIDRRVRDWLKTMPGLFEDWEDNQTGVLRLAWGLSGIECSLPDFTDALARCGYKPRPVRRGHADGVTVWQLALPEGVKAPVRA